MLDSFVVCDLETTGLTPRQHEIIEFGLVLVEGGQIKDTFYSLVRPKQKLPVSIRCLTGLDDEQLKDSPELCVILPRVLDFLHDYPLVGHNVGFDKEFLEAAAGKLNNPTYDTLELARIVLTFAPSYRLSDLCSFLGIENRNKHRALSDALATVELYHRLVASLRELDGQILSYLTAFLQRASSSWAGPLSGLNQQVI
jgi:ATP-dependent DNA helicase DinG